MLTKATIDKLKALGIDADALIKGVTDEGEHEVKVPEGQLFTDEEIQKRDKAKSDLARDLLMKELKKDAGLDYTGEGSLDGKRFISELTKKAESEAIKEPDAKVKSLNEQIQILQKKNEEYEAKVATIQKEANEAKFNAELLAELPGNRAKLIADNEYLTLVKANLEFSEEGVKRNGELLRNDKTAAPISRKEAIEQFFSERKWIEEQGTGVAGRAGGNSQVAVVGKPQSMKEAQEQWAKDNPGKSIGTAEFQTYVVGLKKENPSFNASIV